MNKLFKRIAGCVLGVTVAAGAFALSACGDKASSGSYDVFGGNYIVSHTEGSTVKYTFEAENTNIYSKKGTAFSGTRDEEDMLVTGIGASNGYCVAGLCKKAVSVNFVIVSDRDVNDATLILRLGSEMSTDITLDASIFQVRVDPVVEEDVKYYEGADGGAWGSWDQFFLGYYYTPLSPTPANELGTAEYTGYILDEYECGDIEIYATDTDPCGFDDFTVCTTLKLQKGLNCISLITNNDTVPSTTNSNAATVYATAPTVDCIKITTSAQLGLYNPMSYSERGVSADKACTFVNV